MAQAFTNDDLYLHRKVTSLHGLRGGRRLVAAVRAADRAKDDYTSNLWEFSIDGGEARQMTFSGSDKSPRLAPDGRCTAFISGRDGTPQMYCMPGSGGEARQVGCFPTGVSAFRWMPDAKAWIVTAAVATAPPSCGPWAALRPAEHPAPDVEVAWRLPYKEDGVGNVLRRSVHLFRVDAESGQQQQLTQGAFDVMGFDVSPDGATVAYTRMREGRYAHSYDLWVVEIESGAARRLTTDHAMVMQPAWSPDGRRLAFTGAVDEGDAQPRLWVVDAASGQVTEICPGELDVADPESVQWSADGSRILLLRAWRGRHQIAAIDPG